MMMNAATMQVVSEPTNVSILPYLISRMSIPLSTTADCWKKTCHGVIVVPMLAMTSVTNAAPPRPACVLGQKPLPTASQPSLTLPVFIAQNAAGMYTRLKKQKNRVIFSKVQ